MTFTAKVKRFSATWTMWKGQNRVSGVIENVLFRKLQNGDYVSGLLAPAQIPVLQQLDDVILEAVEVAPPAAAAAPEETDDEIVQELTDIVENRQETPAAKVQDAAALLAAARNRAGKKGVN